MIHLFPVTRENFSRFQEDILSIEQSSFASPWDVHSFSSEIEREISHFWVAVLDNVLVGYIVFWMFAGEAHLLNIAVQEACRRRGMGRRLLHQMLHVAVEANAETAWLDVRPSNLAARSLYRKMGFREAGRRPGYYTDTREDAIIMSMHLHGRSIAMGGRDSEKSEQRLSI